MYTETTLDKKDKSSFYDGLNRELHHLLEGETNPIANLSNASALLNVHLDDINWVGFYLFEDASDELVLGPFQGKPACIRIPRGRGVCGTAFERQETIVVPDVQAFPSHIACDAASRSEIVVPIIVGEHVVGVLDIDSPTSERFNDGDALGLEQVVATLCKHVNFR